MDIDQEKFKRLNFEIKRKIFHISSIILPILYFFWDKVSMIVLLSLASGVVLYSDISRFYNSKLRSLILAFFSRLMRPEEKEDNLHLSGMSYLFLGFLTVVIISSREIAITAMMILIVSDAAAAIVGIRIGKPLFNGKSLAGLLAFILSAIFINILICLILGCKINFIPILFSCIITGLCEFFSKQIRINDNFCIPVIYALSSIVIDLII